MDFGGGAGDGQDRRGVRDLSGVRGLSLEQTKDGVRARLSTGNRHYLPYRQRRSGIELRGPALRKGEWNDVRVFSDKTESWVEVNGVRGDVSDVRGWQFGPLIGGLGVTPGKADYFPGEIRSLSVLDIPHFLRHQIDETPINKGRD